MNACSHFGKEWHRNLPCMSGSTFKFVAMQLRSLQKLRRNHRSHDCANRRLIQLLGNLSKDVFERRTSTGSEAFFLFLCLDAIKFSLLTFFSLLKTIYPRVLTKPLPNDAKSPLPVDVRRLKTLLLQVPILFLCRRKSHNTLPPDALTFKHGQAS